MKAIEYFEYGSPAVLKLNELSKPVPSENQILVKVHASSVTAADIMMREGKPKLGRLYLGLNKPKRKVLGFDFAGEVAELGSKVTTFSVGDRVFGGSTTLGCYGEYLLVDINDVIATMPPSLSFEEAAPVSSSAITVLNFLKRLASIKKGDKILINGASGGLGTYAVQVAKHIEAEVTGVCSTGNVDLVKSLGADHVIDYKKHDFTKMNQKYDIIFDTVAKSSFEECKASLTENGIYLTTVMSLSGIYDVLKTSIRKGKRAKSSSTGLLPKAQRLEYLKELRTMFQSGVVRTVVDRSYPLSKMADAHTYVQQGHKKGNVVIKI